MGNRRGGRFHSRVDGFMARRPHWICDGCGVVFTDTKPVRPYKPRDKGPFIGTGGNNVRRVMACTNCDGREFTYFPSKLEYLRYRELKLLLDAEQIRELKIQPSYALTINAENFTVRLDFSYIDQETGALIVEDVKSPGTDTPLSRIKRALVAEHHGVMVMLTSPNKRR